eukprot:scaffold4946_cov139-Skeletonema_dohrnii-CCMP3373.AAC.1
MKTAAQQWKGKKASIFERITPEDLITSSEERVPACGSDYYDYDAAGNCGAVCSNGHSNCLSGEFCWHVECGATPPVTSTTSPMLSKYQCGYDRTEALTCQEICYGDLYVVVVRIVIWFFVHREEAVFLRSFRCKTMPILHQKRVPYTDLRVQQ